VALVLVVVGVIALFLLRTYRDLIRRFVPKRLQGYYDHLHEGTLGSFRRVPLLFLLSVGVWLCEIGRFFFVALALNLIGGSLLHIAAATTFIALSEALLSTVPFTSGGVGLVEGGMLGVILLFTPSHDLAAAGVLLDRVISLFSILLIGFLIFLITSGRQVAKKAKAA
jgi:uncharacterized protein (TIRG00374 family)